MRIVAGLWRGRPLLAPAGQATRPSSERLREALFSMLASRIGSFEGLTVLDLFAGSGALGLEALSRGAARASFVERDARALDALRANIARLKAAGTEVIGADVSALRAPGSGPFDLIFCDPPYGSGAGAVALDRLNRLGWFSPSAWIALELARDEPLEVKAFTLAAERAHGKGRVALLRPAPFRV